MDSSYSPAPQTANVYKLLTLCLLLWESSKSLSELIEKLEER